MYSWPSRFTSSLGSTQSVTVSLIDLQSNCKESWICHLGLTVPFPVCDMEFAFKIFMPRLCFVWNCIIFLKVFFLIQLAVVPESRRKLILVCLVDSLNAYPVMAPSMFFFLSVQHGIVLP